MRTEISVHDSKQPTAPVILHGVGMETYNVGISHVIVNQQDGGHHTPGSTKLSQLGPTGPNQFVVHLGEVNAYDGSVSLPLYGERRLVAQRSEL